MTPRIRIPRLRLWLLVVVVLAATVWIWAASSPIAHYHFHRTLRGDREAAWKEAVRLLPHERWERELARLLLEHLADERVHTSRRRAAVHTLGGLPRARDLTLDVLVDLALDPSSPLQVAAIDALASLRPLPDAVLRRVAAQYPAVEDPAARRLYFPCRSTLSLPFRPEPLWVRGEFRHERGCWPLPRDPMELLALDARGAAPLARIVCEGSKGDAVRAIELLIELGPDAEAAIPELCEMLFAIEAHGEEAVLLLLISLGSTAYSAVPTLLEPSHWPPASALERAECAHQSLLLARALVALQADLAPEERRVEPAIDALQAILRIPRIDLATFESTSLLEVIGAPARRAVPDLLALLPSVLGHRPTLRAVLRALVTIAPRHPEVRPRIAELAEAHPAQWLLPQALACLDADNPARNREVLERVVSARRLPAYVGHPSLWWTEPLDPVRQLERAPRPELLAMLHATDAEARAVAVSLVGKIAEPDETALADLRNMMGGQSSSRTWQAGITLLELDALDEVSAALWLPRLGALSASPRWVGAIPPWFETPWMQRALETLPADSLVEVAIDAHSLSLLESIPPDRLPPELALRLAEACHPEREPPPSRRDIDWCVDATLRCVPPDRQQPAVDRLAYHVRNSSRELSLAAACGLARLDALPRSWMPVLFEALRAGQDDPRQVLEALQEHEW